MVVGLYLIFKVEAQYVFGMTIALISAFLAAVFSLINGKLVQNHRPSVISFYELGVGVLFLSIVLIVKGDLTIGASGTVEAKGAGGGTANAPPNSSGGAGAGAGGGSIMIIHAGSATNNGSISAGGGNKGTGRQGSQNPLNPGEGGAGGVHTIQVKE